MRKSDKIAIGVGAGTGAAAVAGISAYFYRSEMRDAAEHQTFMRFLDLRRRFLDEEVQNRRNARVDRRLQQRKTITREDYDGAVIGERRSTFDLGRSNIIDSTRGSVNSVGTENLTTPFLQDQELFHRAVESLPSSQVYTGPERDRALTIDMNTSNVSHFF